MIRLHATVPGKVEPTLILVNPAIVAVVSDILRPGMKGRSVVLFTGLKDYNPADVTETVEEIAALLEDADRRAAGLGRWTQ